MKVSIKTVNITPPVGMQMAGYTERTHGALGVHDPITAQAIVIDDGINKVAYVSCDVIGVDLYVTTKVRELVSDVTDIPKTNIMISAIHTHSSVFACRLNGQNFMPTAQFNEESDLAYYQQFIQNIAGAIIWANNTLEDAKVGIGFGEITGLGTNRNDVNAYYDSSVSVVKFVNTHDKMIGLLINHACHPTVLNHDNYLFSADYVGYLRKHLTNLYPESQFVYSQGAAGSSSTRYTKNASTFEEADRLSLILVGEVIKIISRVELKDSVKVSGHCLPLTLDVKQFPSDEECQSEIDRYTLALDKMKRENASEQDIRKMYVTLQGAQRNYIKKKNIHSDSITSEMQSLNIGVCSIVGIPADCFGEIARDIKLLEHSNPIIVAGYTNDFLSYILSKEGYLMDCYEKNMTIATESAHDIIVDLAADLLKQSD